MSASTRVGWWASARISRRAQFVLVLEVRARPLNTRTRSSNIASLAPASWSLQRSASPPPPSRIPHSATASRSPLAPNLTVFAFQHERVLQLGRSDLHRGFEEEDRRFEREERVGLRSFCVGGGHGGGGIGRSRRRGGGLKGVESRAASCVRARVQL
ncbi:hypothetical protein C8J57DRAFT_1510194 [Mycena rebaudengoi]|nr:hypothetical protein C8J57DRAFT_1510194 [Mycena rebaudengoi]